MVFAAKRHIKRETSIIPPIDMTSTQLRTILFVVGLLSILLSLFWLRDENGNPKKGRIVLVLGLMLGIVTIAPGWALQKHDERIAFAQELQKTEKNVGLEETLRKTDLEL
jgi:hypothetical protein